MKLPYQVGAVLEHLEDQRAFIRDTLRVLNDQMSIVERCIHDLCLVIKASQETPGDKARSDFEAKIVAASFGQ